VGQAISQLTSLAASCLLPADICFSAAVMQPLPPQSSEYSPSQQAARGGAFQLRAGKALDLQAALRLNSSCAGHLLVADALPGSCWHSELLPLWSCLAPFAYASSPKSNRFAKSHPGTRSLVAASNAPNTPSPAAARRQGPCCMQSRASVAPERCSESNIPPPVTGLKRNQFWSWSNLPARTSILLYAVRPLDLY
jgi:hypothetical protein